MNTGMLKAACNGLKAYYANASECEKIVIESAIASTVGAAVLGAIPAAGPTVAQVAAGGIVISMYVRINQKLGLTLAKDILKSILSVIGIEIGATIGVTVLATVVSFIPVVGQLGAGVMSAAAQFVFVYVCGYLYIKILIALSKNKTDFNNLSAADVKDITKEAIKKEDIKKLKKEAAEAHKEAEESGELEKAKTQCPYCHQPHDENARFCPGCGERLIFDDKASEANE